MQVRTEALNEWYVCTPLRISNKLDFIGVKTQTAMFETTAR